MTLDDFQVSQRRSFNLRSRREFTRFTPSQWAQQAKGKEIESEESEPSRAESEESDPPTAESEEIELAETESEHEPPPRPQKLPPRRRPVMKVATNVPFEENIEPERRRPRMKNASNAPIPNSALRRLRNDGDADQVVLGPRRRRGRK